MIYAAIFLMFAVSFYVITSYKITRNLIERIEKLEKEVKEMRDEQKRL